MPRKSVASLTILRPGIDGRPTYISPPPGLSQTHSKMFSDIVRTMPPDHFRDCDTPTLLRFVEAIIMCERAGREMEATGGPVVDGKVNPWFGVQQRSSKMVCVLATRLRVTPYSRRDPKQVYRNIQQESAYDRLVADEQDQRA